MKINEFNDRDINEVIRKLDSGKYRLYSKKGKNLGTFDSKAGAEKHEREVQAFKHMEATAVEPDPAGYSHTKLTAPANTLVINTPGELDWYKMGEFIANLNKEDPHEFGQSESDMVVTVANREQMDKLKSMLDRLGAEYKEIGGTHEHPEVHTEAWSKKYKRSIDCNNPKGFSQRAHCQGRKKTNEDIAGVAVPKNYNPDSETYRGVANRIPNSKSISKRDITVKGQRAEMPDDSYEPDMLAGVNKEQLKQLITAALDTLSKREAMILRARFGIEPFTQDHTLEQVGNAMGISRNRVRELEARALRKLRHPKVSRTLRSMLGDDIGNLPDWETIVAVAAAAKLTPMVVKAMWSTAKGAYKLKKFADRMGIKIADKLVGESNPFTDARMNAIKAGKKHFTVKGKKYPVTGDTSDEEEAIANEARKNPMDKQVQVPGVGVYSLGQLQKNVAGKLHDLAARAAKNDPSQFRQIKKLLDDGIVQLFLDAIVASYNDLARQTVHRREFGEAEDQEPPVDMARIIKLIQRLESDQYIQPEKADEMRRATQAMASGRDTLYPDAVLQLLTMVA